MRLVKNILNVAKAIMFRLIENRLCRDVFLLCIERGLKKTDIVFG